MLEEKIFSEEWNIAKILRDLPDMEKDELRLQGAVVAYQRSLKNLEASQSLARDTFLIDSETPLMGDQTTKVTNVNALISQASKNQMEQLKCSKDNLEFMLSQLVSSLSCVRSEIHGRRVTLAISRNSRQHLMCRKNELVLLLNELKFHLSAVRRAPNEIWHEIFRICNHFKTSSRRSRPQILTISHVCKQWREITLNSQVLYVLYRDKYLPFHHWRRLLLAKAKEKSAKEAGSAARGLLAVAGGALLARFILF